MRLTQKNVYSSNACVHAREKKNIYGATAGRIASLPKVEMHIHKTRQYARQLFLKTELSRKHATCTETGQYEYVGTYWRQPPFGLFIVVTFYMLTRVTEFKSIGYSMEVSRCPHLMLCPTSCSYTTHSSISITWTSVTRTGPHAYMSSRWPIRPHATTCKTLYRREGLYPDEMSWSSSQMVESEGVLVGAAACGVVAHNRHYMLRCDLHSGNNPPTLYWGRGRLNTCCYTLSSGG